LDDGTLYVAEFNEGQSGEWLAIKPETRGLDSLAKVLIFARQAGSALRTTTMDRSEWIAAYPYAVEAY
jgi:secreted PhoX family phosphatase